MYPFTLGKAPFNVGPCALRHFVVSRLERLRSGTPFSGGSKEW